MRIMIIGAGSLGLLFAAKLSALCDHLTVIARTKEQADQLAQEGIMLGGTTERHRTTRGGFIEFSHYEVDKESVANATVPVHPYDYIFLMVKQPAITKELAQYIYSRRSEITYLVSFQNGIGHEADLSEDDGENKLLLAVTTEGARRESPTEVSHTGHGITYIGASNCTDPDHKKSTHFLLVNLLQEAGFRAEMSKNMEVRIWSKLIINAVINPLTAILHVKNGELLDSTWTKELMFDLYREACFVAEAKEIKLPDALWQTIISVCEATSRNHSSMLQDIEQSRPTEIDRINGSLLQMADELKLELPTHRTVYRLVKALE
ncbi:2-dehydropantoate 2-reductase [Paenibacillus chondroitinus]|uniref:2-dehydropantoate 2-reductase n=1 Tax=Paenibacillus chondroitinus TaxID=59842 RepID=A0ABU6D4E3_9BACL|nr:MULTISPECIES: 2-dehydropantoate 2-reductase [Paenibacillus]MCY9658386.1 2-dehydropantoate 2-reductase [Paenibacillus anseongense]MEB4792615.1 2-dehydropantoate 2-reductase [Paenibacillus chondroitinus]